MHWTYTSAECQHTAWPSAYIELHNCTTPTLNPNPDLWPFERKIGTPVTFCLGERSHQFCTFLRRFVFETDPLMRPWVWSSVTAIVMVTCAGRTPITCCPAVQDDAAVHVHLLLPCRWAHRARLLWVDPPQAPSSSSCTPCQPYTSRPTINWNDKQRCRYRLST